MGGSRRDGGLVEPNRQTRLRALRGFAIYEQAVEADLLDGDVLGGGYGFAFYDVVCSFSEVKILAARTFCCVDVRHIYAMLAGGSAARHSPTPA
jgi:hypothetical protein